MSFYSVSLYFNTNSRGLFEDIFSSILMLELLTGIFNQGKLLGDFNVTAEHCQGWKKVTLAIATFGLESGAGSHV